MSAIPQINGSEEIEKAYQYIVKIYGKDIFREPRRAVGALADIVPKMTREINALSVALQEKVPALLESDRSGRKAQTENVKRAIELMKGKGFTEDEAFSVVENLGQVLGIETAARPEYKEGEQIPYVNLPKGATLQEAVDSLNHIRWFLNHEKEYVWIAGKGSLTELRRLLNRPQKNKEKIEAEYKKLVQSFLNNPYESSFLLEESEKKTAFTTERFENYFVTANGEPIPVGFARQYTGADAGKAIADFSMQKKTFLEKVNRLKRKYKRSSSLESYKKSRGEGMRFVFFGIVILAFMGYLVKDVVLQTDVRPMMKMLKGYHYNIFGLIMSYKNSGAPEQYFIGCSLGAVMAAIVVLFLGSILYTFVCCMKLNHALRPVKRMNKAAGILEKEIPEKAELMEGQMKEYWKSGKNALLFKKHDYRNILKIEAPVRPKRQNPVKKGSKRLRILTIACCVLLLIGRRSGFMDKIVMGSQMLGGVPMEEMLMDSGENVIDSPGKVLYTLSEADESELSGVSRVQIADYSQSSYLTTGNSADYTVRSTVDQDEQTSWQEGVEGNGEGESIWFALDQTYEIQYITLKLGNWRSADSFQENGRPEILTVHVGEMSATYVFPDEQREFVMKLDEPLTGANVKLVVNTVYPGCKQSDTCITEVGIYGVPKSDAAGNKKAQVQQMDEELD